MPTDFGPLPAPVTRVGAEPEPEPEPAVVEVRRRAGLAALVGVLAAGVATLFLARAVDSGGGAGLGAGAPRWALVALAYLAVLLDARTPLLVADEQGVRLRLGRSWPA